MFIYYDYHLFFGNPEWRDQFVSLVEGMMRTRGISKPEEEENHGEDLEVKTLFGVAQELAGLFSLLRVLIKTNSG